MTTTVDKQIQENLQNVEQQRQAFEQLVNSYQKVLYFHIRRIVIDHEDASDVLQNTFLKAWKNIAKFRGDANVKTWLYRIATNESLSFLKRKKGHFEDLKDLQDDLRHSLSSGKYIDGDTIQHLLHQAILTLPEKQRMVFNMRYFDEMKYEEIGEILSLSVGGLKANYHHAVKKVEQFIKNQQD
ncbi:MAG: sigma-70 family RNA polymerase sigma factor [Bacteroidota bacterium]